MRVYDEKGYPTCRICDGDMKDYYIEKTMESGQKCTQCGHEEIHGFGKIA